MIRRLLVATAVAALPAVAAAHAGDAAHDHGLTAGFMHPFTGLDHLAAMLAVGLWSALTQTGRRMLAAPFAFAGLLLVGALAGLGLGAQGLAVPGIAGVSARPRGRENESWTDFCLTFGRADRQPGITVSAR